MSWMSGGSMGKRSNFERKERDFYPTPKEAVSPLLKHLPEKFTYAEPCCGEHHLINAFSEFFPKASCLEYSDIDSGANALDLKDDKRLKGIDYIITNPPWTRSILHPLISHFRSLRPTWLLFDAPWAYTLQSKPFLSYCSDIVVVGRLKWIPGSKYTSKDDCCWYKFIDHGVETIFHNDKN